MKRILHKSIYVLLFLSFTAQAQNYTFSKFNATYSDLTGNTVVSTPSWDDFSIIQKKMPFAIQFFGQPQDSLYIVGGFVAFKQVGEGNFPGPQIYFCDAGYVEHASLSNSTISILVSGTAPNRIYKVQIKNAGYVDDESSTESANFQLWLYETTNVIEIHFGASSGSSATYSPLSGPTVGLFNSATLFISLSGNAANPVASTIAASLSINGNPASGQVYRFTPSIVGINENESNSPLSLYPNPSVGEINLVSNSNLNNANLTITSISGQVVYEQANITLAGSQSLKLNTDLAKGLYVLSVFENTKVISSQKIVIN